MTQQILDSYDEIPYPGDPIEGTHPDLLATIGRLRGLPAPAPDRCRVLELGCGDGGNWFYAYSGAHLTIIDTPRGVRHILRGSDGRRAVFGDVELFQRNPLWRDHVLFYEYFHGDTGRGVGASHQSGWTSLIANLFEHTPERRIDTR